MTIDPEALAASLRRLSRQETDEDLLPALRSVADACVDIFGVSGSGVMIVDEQNIPHYVASSTDGGRVLENAETETRQGPCTEAFVINRPVSSEDLLTDDRWPELAAAVEGHGIRAVLGLPVRLAASPVGTLDVYMDHPHVWTDSERNALQSFADVVEATLGAAMAAHAAGRLASQLQYALDYRVSIERGIGYLMARDGVDAVRSFNALRQAARSRRVKIGVVAEQLLRTGRLPDEA